MLFIGSNLLILRSMVISLDLIIAIAAVIIMWLVFSWSIQVLKVSIKTALTVAAIILALQIFFGIRSEQIWQGANKIIEISENFIVSNF